MTCEEAWQGRNERLAAWLDDSESIQQAAAAAHHTPENFLPLLVASGKYACVCEQMKARKRMHACARARKCTHMNVKTRVRGRARTHTQECIRRLQQSLVTKSSIVIQTLHQLSAHAHARAKTHILENVHKTAAIPRQEVQIFGPLIASDEFAHKKAHLWRNRKILRSIWVY